MSKRKNNRANESANSVANAVENSITPPHLRILPAISVIMPLYNVEKYVAECLDSILAQTFQDFELIIVDDCSTDSSVAIVESYRERFGERFKLVKTKSNSGGAGFPRNKGMELSRGEYIFFMDPDDTIKSTALEELYTLAKKFDADIVHCEKPYAIPDEFYHDEEYRKNLKPSIYPMHEKTFITEPVMLTDDFALRALEFSQKWLSWSIWLQLIRRDFIFENELWFGNFIREDMTFTICEICCAKRYLVVPNVVYYYRRRDGSTVHSKPDVASLIKTEIKSFKGGIRYLEEYFSQSKIFSKRPDLKYTLFDMFTQEVLTRLNNLYEQIPPHEIDQILRHEFGDNRDALTPFMFSAMNSYRLQLLQSYGRISELKREIRQLKSKE